MSAEPGCGTVPAPSAALLQRAAALLQVVGHPARVHVLLALAREGALTAGQLSERVRIEASALSHHLRLLRDARLVRSAPRGRHRVYALDDPHVAHIVEDAVRHVAEDPQAEDLLPQADDVTG
ncbi:MAG: metalloregulator ArsR/SmtB family transcription factor [Myxococcota bacterium]